MNTKLTLRMDQNTVRKAKMEAKRRGKSVSRMVAEFIESIGMPQNSEKKPFSLVPWRPTGFSR